MKRITNILLMAEVRLHGKVVFENKNYKVITYKNFVFMDTEKGTWGMPTTDFLRIAENLLKKGDKND